MGSGDQSPLGDQPGADPGSHRQENQVPHLRSTPNPARLLPTLARCGRFQRKRDVGMHLQAVASSGPLTSRAGSAPTRFRLADQMPRALPLPPPVSFSKESSPRSPRRAPRRRERPGPSSRLGRVSATVRSRKLAPRINNPGGDFRSAEVQTECMLCGHVRK